MCVCVSYICITHDSLNTAFAHNERTPPSHPYHAWQVAVNGAQIGGAVTVPVLGWAQFSLSYTAGTLTASAIAANGSALASVTRTTWGAPAALRLTVDAPSRTSGTGTALYLDGSDVALLRCEVRAMRYSFVHASSMMYVVCAGM